MLLSGTIAIKNNKGQRVSLWIFTSANLFPPAVNSTFQFLISSGISFIIFLKILYIFDNLLSRITRTYFSPFLIDSYYAYFFPPFIVLREDVLINCQ